MDKGRVFNDEVCRHCDQYLKVAGFGKMPCSWDSLSERQRAFLQRSGMDAARWCEHREAERTARPDGGAVELPKEIPIQGNLI